MGSSPPCHGLSGLIPSVILIGQNRAGPVQPSKDKVPEYTRYLPPRSTCTGTPARREGYIVPRYAAPNAWDSRRYRALLQQEALDSRSSASGFESAPFQYLSLLLPRAQLSVEPSANQVFIPGSTPKKKKNTTKKTRPKRNLHNHRNNDFHNTLPRVTTTRRCNATLSRNSTPLRPL